MKILQKLLVLLPLVTPNCVIAQSPPNSSNAANSQTQTVCTEPDKAVRVINGMNVGMAYPPYAVMRGIQGDLKARIYVNNEGKIEEVQFVEITPPGVFDSHSLVEIGKMTFTPARHNCENIGSIYNLHVVFFIR